MYSVILDGNPFLTLDDDTLTPPWRLVNLKSLSLQHCGITAMTEKSLEGVDASSLLLLNLAHNRLQTLPKDVFAPLLRGLGITLDLRGNPFHPCDAHWECLVPLPIFTQSTCMSIACSGSGPGSACGVCQEAHACDMAKKHIALQGRGLTHLPSNWFGADCAMFESLDLSHNTLDLMHVSSTFFANLTHVTDVSLSWNPIAATPPRLLELPRLERLDVSGTLLTATTLDQALPREARVRYLNVSHCLQVDTLADEVFRGLELVELDVSSSGLRTMAPQAVAFIETLRVLYMNDLASLESLDAGQFQGSAGLALVQMQQSPLKHLPRCIFEPLVHLGSVAEGQGLYVSGDFTCGPAACNVVLPSPLRLRGPLPLVRDVPAMRFAMLFQDSRAGRACIDTITLHAHSDGCDIHFAPIFPLLTLGLRKVLAAYPITRISLTDVTFEPIVIHLALCPGGLGHDKPRGPSSRLFSLPILISTSTLKYIRPFSLALATRGGGCGRCRGRRHHCTPSSVHGRLGNTCGRCGLAHFLHRSTRKGIRRHF